MKTLLKIVIVLVVIIGLVVGLIFGGMAIAYNKFAKPETGISFTNAMSLVRAIKKEPKKGSEMLILGYDIESDSKDFLDRFKEALFISSDSTLTVDHIFNSFTSTTATGEASTASMNLDPIVDNIDFDFSQIPDPVPEKPIVSITGKNFAAIIQQVINNSSIEQIRKLESSLGMKAKDAIRIQNIVFNEVVKSMPNGESKNVKQATIIAKFNLLAALNAQFDKNQQIPKIAKYFLTNMVPKNVYVKCSTYPEEPELKANLEINNMVGKNKENCDVMLANIAKNRPNADILKIINTTMTDLIKSIKDKGVDVEFTNANTFNIAALDAILKGAGIENLSGKEFLELVRDLTTSPMPVEAFDPSAVEVFINQELAPKYALKSGFAQTLNAANLRDKIGDVKGNISFSNYNFDKTIEEQRVEISDSVLAALVGDYLKANAPEGMDITLLRTTIAESSDPTKFSFNITSSIDVYKMITNKLGLDEASAKAKFINKLVKAIFTEDAIFNIELSANVDANKYYASIGPDSAITYNTLSVDETNNMFSKLNTLMEKFGQGDLGDTFTNMSSKIIPKVDLALKNIQNSFKRNPSNESEPDAKAVQFGAGKIILPSIYEVIEAKVYPEGKVGPTANELQSLLNNLHNNPSITYLNDAARHPNGNAYPAVSGLIGSGKTEIYDREIGEYTASVVDESIGLPSLAKVLQSMLITKGASTARDNFNAINPSHQLIEGQEYLILTIEVEISAYLGLTTDMPEGLLPDKNTFTLVCNIDNFSSSDDDIFIIDELSQENMNIMNNLIGVFKTDSSLEMNSILSKVKTKLEDIEIGGANMGALQVVEAEAGQGVGKLIP